MSTNGSAPSERADIESLLPWYATGRLSEEDRARVTAWLVRDPELSRQLEIIEEERRFAVEAAEEGAVPSSLSPQRILSRIPDRTVDRASFLTTAMHRLDDILAGLSPARLRWAAAAMVILVAVQAAGIALLLNGGGQDYQTASGPGGTSASGAFILVRLNDRASLIELSATLKDLGATITDGPTADGLYRVRIGPADIDDASRQAKLSALRSRGDVFQLVLPEPLKRPPQ
jgi:hypothetical protein